MAIAFDATSSKAREFSVMSQTVAHTCTGANQVLATWVSGDYTIGAITGVTYAGVPMNLLTYVKAGGDRYGYFFYLLGPTTGTNNVVVSTSSPIDLQTINVSLTGVAQSAQPDALTTNTDTGATITGTVVTVAPSSWVLMGCRSYLGVTSGGAGVGAFYNLTDDAIASLTAPIVGAGSTSMTVNVGGTLDSCIMVSFAPVPANEEIFGLTSSMEMDVSLATRPSTIIDVPPQWALHRFDLKPRTEERS